MLNVFIIHSGADKASVQKEVIEKLRDMAPQTDILILEGKEKFWKREAYQKLKQAQLVLFVVGENSKNSKNIGWEIKKALNLNKFLMYYPLEEDFEPHDAINRKNQFTGLREPAAKKADKIEDVAARINSYVNQDYRVLNSIENLDRSELMEQYKLFFQTSETLVERRQNVNSFYISVNAAIVSVAGVLLTLGDGIQEKMAITVTIALAGIILSVSWIKILQAYGTLNSSKMKIISLLEKELPASLFDSEWAVMSDRLNSKKYVSFTDSEKSIPKVFCAIYLIYFLVAVLVLLFWK